MKRTEVMLKCRGRALTWRVTVTGASFSFTLQLCDSVRSHLASLSSRRLDYSNGLPTGNS